MHQRRRDRSRTHRSLWPSHLASAYQRCLHITPAKNTGGHRERERERDRVKAERPKGVRSSSPTGGDGGTGGRGSTEVAEERVLMSSSDPRLPTAPALTPSPHERDWVDIIRTKTGDGQASFV